VDVLGDRAEIVVLGALVLGSPRDVIEIGEGIDIQDVEVGRREEDVGDEALWWRYKMSCTDHSEEN
jgi:hypothetical protein